MGAKVRVRSLFRRLWEVAMPERRWVRYVQTAGWLALIVVAAIAGIGGADANGRMVQGAQEFNITAILQALGYSAAAYTLRAICDYFSSRLMGVYGADVKCRMSDFTCKRLAQVQYAWLERQQTGDLLSRVNENLRTASGYITTHMPSLVSLMITSVFSITYLFSRDWRMGAVFLGLAPLVVWLQAVLSKPSEKAYKAKFAAEGRRATQAQDAVTNLSTVRVYGLENEMEKRYRARFADVWKTSKTANRIALFPMIGQIPISVVPAVVVTLIGIWLVFQGQFTIAGLITIIALMEPLSEVMWKLPERFRGIREASAASQRIYEIWDAPQERSQIGLPLEMENDETLYMEQVSFGYDAQTQVLKEFSMTLRQGEKVALVGRSGCGKSTVLKLVAGLYQPTAGRIAMWGCDTAQLAPTALRAHMAYITQDTYLFPESIRDNILLGAQGSNQSDVDMAAQHAGLEFTHDWPQQLDTQVGERGAQLSGGQKQRVSIARALIRDTPLVLLDEATSALDTVMEKQVQGALEELLKDRTALIVAHRLSSVRHADRILVMEDGRVVEEDTHDALMAQNGLYATLFRDQAQEKGEGAA